MTSYTTTTTISLREGIEEFSSSSDGEDTPDISYDEHYNLHVGF